MFLQPLSLKVYIGTFGVFIRMAAAIKYLTDYVEDLRERWPDADPRADIYPFTDSPWPNNLHCMFYLFIVCYAGPKFMENRPAFDLKFLIIPYNWALVALSTFLFYEFFMAGWGTGDYSYLCQV